MKDRKPLSLAEKQDIIKYLRLLDASQKHKVLAFIKRIKKSSLSEKPQGNPE